MKLTKIVCTIWPSSRTKEKMSQMIDLWMNVVRFNFSHWEHQEKAEKIKIIREIMSEKWVFVSLLLDTKWPEIRTCKLENWQNIKFGAWDKIKIVNQDIIWNKDMISLTYKNLHKDIKKSNQILIADGAVVLEVEDIRWDEVFCVVKNNCELWEKKNVNLPWINVNLPVLEQKDKEDLIFGCQQWFDYVAVSFVKKASDVTEVRNFLDSNGWKHIQIISKIENQEWLDNFDSILEKTDGIMIARWDLGMEMPVEQMPLIQKMMIKKCNEKNKIVITATQMLDSMIKNPRPTRAEATDVANAIIDWTDAVMLSGETANGNYPIESVQTMSNICISTDSTVQSKDIKNDDNNISDITFAIAKWSISTANSINAKYIITASIWWRTAMLVRKFFPKQPIIVFTNYEQVARKVSLIRWCIWFVVPKINNYEQFFETVKNTLIKNNLVEKWDKIVITGWWSIWSIWMTDTIKILEI